LIKGARGLYAYPSILIFFVMSAKAGAKKKSGKIKA
jgi:hypothetical protein